MANMKALAKDTAIYGMSSIVGRFLNYLLVPIYTRVLDPSEYGVVTNLYGYVALILVILTFGMETTFFRFANKEEEQPDTVFTTAFSFVGTLTALFLALLVLFITPIGEAINYQNHHNYMLMMGAVIAIDVMQAIPFCYLRFKKMALKFASLKMLFIALNITLNIGCFVVMGIRDVAYVFMLNLVCSALVTFFFIPEFFRMKWCFDWTLLKRMLSYTWPLFVLGIAGILNQTADKIIFPLVYPDAEEGKALLGIYGGCVKIAMIMAMITQAFRYAYEPIVFAQRTPQPPTGGEINGSRKENNTLSPSKGVGGLETQALGMKYFIIFTLLAFLGVMAYLPILQHIVGEQYQEGMRVVPIVMAAEIMMGVYFNLSFWYKLIDKTIYGAWFSLAGCAVLFAVNLLFIPTYNYMACAWGGFAGYGTAMVLSYVIGQKKNPIAYPVKDIATYVAITVLFYCIMIYLPTDWPLVLRLAINTVLCVLFLAHIIYYDLPLKSLPMVGKYFK